MSKKDFFLAVAILGVTLQMGFCGVAFCKGIAEISIVSEKAVQGFVHPESVAYDAHLKVLYVGQFGSVLKPTLKDGKGKVSKVSLTGEILEEQFLPAQAGVLNKPKGIWVNGNRIWVTDIDVVWIFDLKSRKGRKAVLPGAKFANDPTVIDGALFVSDTEGHQIYRIEPADFLEFKTEPTVVISSAELGFSPNGLCPFPDGSMVVVGYDMAGQDQGIFLINAKGKVKTLAENLGLLDGVCRLDDGTLLITDWRSKSLLRWSQEEGAKSLVKGFMGPADFCVVPEDKGLMVVVPDLVKSELRMIRFKK